MRRLQGSHFLSKGRVLHSRCIFLCSAQTHFLRQPRIRRKSPDVLEWCPVVANLPRQFPLTMDPGFPSIRRLRCLLAGSNGAFASRVSFMEAVKLR